MTTNSICKGGLRHVRVPLCWFWTTFAGFETDPLDAPLLAAGLLAAPYSVWLTALTWAVALFLLGLVEAEHGALTYFLPALAAGIWCALARWSGAAFITPLGALLLLLCAGLGGMALLRGKGWGLDGAQAVGLAAMLLLAAQAQALQLALRPTAEGSQAAFTALLWVPQLYGALVAPFVNRKPPRALGLGLVLAGAVLLAAHVGATYADLRPGTVLFFAKTCLQSAQALPAALLFAGLRGLTNAGEAHRIEHR